MRLCHVVPSLEERHGGPSKSVRALANHLAGGNVQVDLLATEEQPGDFVRRPDDSADIRVFPRVSPRWLSRSPALRAHLLATEADCYHNHALWLLPLRYSVEAARRRHVPLVISPRGMMSGWAWRHRRWRKELARRLVHPGAFVQAAGWHATSPEEADDIRGLGFRQPVCVAPNGVELPGEAELISARAAWLGLVPAAANRPVALFYSRLHRKKRVRELIDLWLDAPRGDWLLLIAGVAEDYHADDLAREIAARGASERIRAVDSTGLPPPYAIASLFLLPSHSENFGLVIAEALAAGLPALVTDTTPWRGLAGNSAGWCVPWSSYGDALAEALRANHAELAARGRQGRAWMSREYSWQHTATLLHAFYADLCHARR